MPWRNVELEPEVAEWLASLDDDASVGPSATSTCWPTKACTWRSRSAGKLSGKLRELRFYLGRRQVRITYYIATGRRIVLLTVFAKTRQRERREVQRAEAAMHQCIEHGHTAEEDQ